MSRILITSWPLAGHVHPKLAIAAALRERGHEAAFYTGATMAPVVEAAGFEVHPFARVDEGEILATVRELEERAGLGRPSLAAVRRFFARCMLAPIPGQLEDVAQIARASRPDAIACDLPMWGPLLIGAETLEIPVALVSQFLGPPAPAPGAPPAGFGLPSPRGPARRAAAWAAARATDRAARGMREQVDALRAQHGLGPLGCSVNEFLGRRTPALIAGVPELDYGRRVVPPGVHYVGDCRWQPPAPPGAEDALAAVPEGRPWVHVAASTVAGAHAGLLSAAVAGLAGRPVEVVASAAGAAPALATLPANAHLVPWADHAQLLPRCAAVVTPGGAGTILAALSAGVPLVVVPTAWDKPDNARRVVEAGVGVRVAPRRCTPETVRAAVERVLADRSYRERARHFAALLAAAPGPAGAAALLERVAHGAAALAGEASR